MKNYEVVIIGGGPAAITLAKIIGKSKSTAVIRPEDHSMIYCAMPYAIEGLLDIEKTLKKDSLVTDSGADLIRSIVTQIDFKEKKVTLQDSSELGWDKLVIATGAVPFIPPVAGHTLKGVKGFKTEIDLKEIQKMIGLGLKKAVVVGAGAVGIELALALTEAKLTVDLVDMTDSVLPNLVDREMSEDLETEIIRDEINLHLGTKVVALEGKEWVERVKLDNGSTIHFDSYDECSETHNHTHDGIVLFATGMKPEIGLVRDSDIELGRDGIVINSKMETSVANVYAIGDCAQYISAINGEVIPGKLATNAVPMGKILGFNMMGQNRKYPGFYNGAATKVGKFYAGGTGYTEKNAKVAGFEVLIGKSELTSKFPIMPGATKMKFKLVVNKADGKIIGAQVISGEPVTGIVDLCTFAIQKQTTVEELTYLSYSSQPYQSFYPSANGVVKAAEDVFRQLNS
jgi:NADH oxidase (H2O2-forming)